MSVKQEDPIQRTRVERTKSVYTFKRGDGRENPHRWGCSSYSTFCVKKEEK